jgi:hypothetical protein
VVTLLAYILKMNVSDLFRCHPETLLGFPQFLPEIAGLLPKIKPQVLANPS